MKLITSYSITFPVMCDGLIYARGLKLQSKRLKLISISIDPKLTLKGIVQITNPLTTQLQTDIQTLKKYQTTSPPLKSDNC